MQPYVTWPSALALIAPLGLAVAFLTWSWTAPKRQQGWKYVTAGVGYGIACHGSLGLATLIAVVWLSVGSHRSDAAFQMQVAWWLSLAFGLSAAWCAHRMAAIARMGVRWRGGEVFWRQSGGEVGQPISKAVAITPSRWGGATRIRFDTGQQLCLDEMAARAGELLADIEDASGLADPDRAPEH